MSLSSEEYVIYSTRLSKKLFVKPLLLSVVLVAVAFLAQNFATEAAPYLFWPCIALAAVVLLPAFVTYYLSHFILTNQRVIIKHGLLTRTSYEMILEKIESITVNQSLSDRMLWGSGTLVLTGTGGTKEQFRDVGDAVSFQDHLNEALHSTMQPASV